MAGCGLISVWQKLRRSNRKNITTSGILFLIIYNDDFLCTLFKKKFCLTVILSVLCDLLNHVSTMKFIYLPSVWHLLHNDFLFQIWLENINILPKKKILVFYVNACIVLIFHLVYFWNDLMIWWSNLMMPSSLC